MKNPPKSPTIRANVLATVVAELVRQGVDADPLLRRHIEAMGDIANPYQEVPLDRYVAFFEAAAERIGDTCLGARLGVRFQPEEFGPIGVVFLAAPSLQAALNRLSFFLGTWQSGTRAELELGGETAEWLYQIEDPTIHPRRQDAEFSLAATCAFIRALLGPHWAPLEVHFEHPAHPGASPTARQALGAAFKAPVVFSQPMNRLILDRRDLELQGDRVKQAMAPYLEQHLRDLLAGRAGAESCATQVTYLIAKRLGRQPIDAASLAGELGLSRRTLQRRLTDDGTTLRQLVRTQRALLAERLLASESIPITSIAHTVGYADPAVLSRAFRSWTGKSPTAHRRDRLSA